MGNSPRTGNGSCLSQFHHLSCLTMCLYDGNVAYENIAMLFKNHSLWGAKKSVSIKKAGAERTFPPLFFNPTAVNNKMRNLPTVCVIDPNRNSKRQLHFKQLLPFSLTKGIKGKNGGGVTAMWRETSGHEESTLSPLPLSSRFLLLWLPSVDSNSQVAVDFGVHFPLLSDLQRAEHPVSTKKNHLLFQKRSPKISV